MFVDILILAQLSSGPKYGYEIKKNVQGILGENFNINNNLLYPALKRFEQMGAVVKKVQEQDGKPNRHVYHITKLGSEIFHKMLQEFPRNLAVDMAEFQVRVSFFDLLDVQTRKDILLQRLEVLEAGLRHMRELILPLTVGENMYFPKRMLDLQQALVTQEMDWIFKMMTEVEGR